MKLRYLVVLFLLYLDNGWGYYRNGCIRRIASQRSALRRARYQRVDFPIDTRFRLRMIDISKDIDDILSSLNQTLINAESNSTVLGAVSPVSLLAPISNSAQTTSKVSNRSANNEEGIIPTYLSTLEKSSSNVNDTEILSKMSSSPLSRKYYQIVENLTPPDLLMKFAATAPKPVQEAAKTTIMNFLGSLPNYALDAALVTTSTRLANLLYQMQITGYMLKNAEYVMSLTKSLKGLPKLPPPVNMKIGNYSITPGMNQPNIDITGEVQVKTSNGEVLIVDVQQLTTSLSQEIQMLRKELAILKTERERELKSNLLTYVQALPEKELIKLTEDMSEEVLQTIQLVIATVMQKLGVDPTGPEMILQQNMGQLAQLCMWQLITGYKLRELEALDRGVPIT